MSDDHHRRLTGRVTAAIAMVAIVAQSAFAPVATTEMKTRSGLSDEVLQFVGYKKLASQIGKKRAAIVAKLVEDSAYPALVRSIISVESGWQVNAVSPKDAIGLMQIRLIAAQDYDTSLTREDLFDPITNVELGIRIFDANMRYFNRYSDSEHWALTAYNRGRAGTFALNEFPPTTSYSRKVLQLRNTM